MIYSLQFNRTGKNVSAKLKRFLLTLVIGMFTGLSAFAQITTTTITGYISDGKNPVPNAVITVVHVPSGTPFYALSNDKGIYVIQNVVAGGPYVVRVERLNYVTMIVSDVTAPLGGTVEVDVVIAPSATRLEEVRVFGDAANSSMNFNRSGTGMRFRTEMMDMVPNVGRSLYDILNLTPQGVVMDNGFSVGGGNYRSSMVSVDGASFCNAFGIGSSLPAGGTPISLEAINQLDVNITPFSVRHSGFQGSSINMTTKQGTNKWRGSVYDYFKASALQGQKVGDYDLTSSKTLNNTTGFTVGGPLIKNKLFLFLNGEYTVDNVAGAVVQARPDESYGYGGTTGYTRPTVAAMDGIRQFLIDRFGYDPGRYQNYSLMTPDYKVFARLDWRINDYNIFHIRVSHTHVSEPHPGASSMSPLSGDNLEILSNGETYTLNRYSAGRTSPYALPFESVRYDQVMDFTTVAAELNTRLLNEKSSNMLRLTWSLQNEPRSFLGGEFPTVDILEPYTDINGDRQLAFFTTFGPDPFTYGNLRRVNTLTATDEFTYKTGNHSILTGLQLEWNNIKNGFMQGGGGWYVYDSWQSFVNDVNNVEGAGPSLFMITHANTDTPTEQVFPTFNHTQVSLYAQDEMKFSKFFELSVGLRMEIPFIRFLHDNMNVEFDQIASAHPNSSFGGLSTADYPAHGFHISPRIGFNWDITHKRSLILRGGTGLFTGRIPNVWLVSAIGNSNCLQYQYIANNHTLADLPGFNEDREDIISSLYIGHTYSRQGLPAPTNATILAKDLKMPTSWKTSLSLDILIPGGIKTTIEGIYSFNLNEVCTSVLGYKEDGTIELPGEPVGRTHYTSENIQNRSGDFMSGYYLHNVKKLHGQYFSLSAQLSKDFNFGLNLLASYTYSYATNVTDALNDQVSSLSNTPTVNGYNHPELGYSTYVAPHRVLFGAGYNIKEGEHTATKLGLFYDGLNMGFYGGFFATRYSYLISNVSGLSTPQLMYIPTSDELAAMPFSSESNRAAFEEFISNDRYLSKHRGEYSKRNGALAPWVNRINFRISQVVYFNVSGRRQSLDVGMDLNNVANLLCRKWGAYQVLDKNVLLDYRDGEYTFTSPQWSAYNSLASTWQISLHVKYTF